MPLLWVVECSFCAHWIDQLTAICLPYLCLSVFAPIEVYCPWQLSIPRNATQFFAFIVQLIYISRTTLHYSFHHQGMFHGVEIIWTSLVNAWMADQGRTIHVTNERGTGPLRWWNRDCRCESHTSDLFEYLACLCRTRHFEFQRPYSNPSMCQKCLGAIQINVGGSSSLEDKVKLKERVQWAGRVVFGQGGTIIEKEKMTGQTIRRCPLWTPFTDKPETNSTFSVYSWQIQFGQTPMFRYHSSRIPYWFLRIFHTYATIELSHKLSSFSIGCGGLLGTSWDQSIRTSWPCGYTHISTFLVHSGALVPVTHAARECTAFGDLRSLAQSRVRCCRERMESMCSFRQLWRLQFEETREFFEPRFEETGRLGSQMIKA